MLAGVMLSIVMPTLNAESDLQACLDGLQDGLKAFDRSEIIVADGGSTDATVQIAEHAGAHIVNSEKGRGSQLAAGAAAARGDWLLFVHADTRLADGWPETVAQFIKIVAQANDPLKAAVFRFRLDDPSPMARCLESIVELRTWWFALPYGDQCLLISRKFYQQLGGFKPIPIMEDVDIVRRIGRNRLVVLPCDAITSASRYKHEGYLRRMARNVVCLSMWFAGVAPEQIARIYR